VRIGFPLGWIAPRAGSEGRSERLRTRAASSDGEKSVGDGMFGGLLEPIAPQQPSDPDSSLYNEDFAPTMSGGRIFTVWDMA